MPGLGVNANKSSSEGWVEHVLLDGVLVDVSFEHLITGKKGTQEHGIKRMGARGRGFNSIIIIIIIIIIITTTTTTTTINVYECVFVVIKFIVQVSVR